MKKIPPEVRLERLLEALSADAVEASDAELLETCAELGIKPAMKGSIAFLGLKGIFFFPYVPEKFSALMEPPAAPDPNDSPDDARRQ